MSNDSGLAEPMRVLIQEFQRTVGLVATTKQPSNVLLGTALDELGITAHGHLKRNDPLAKGRQPCRDSAHRSSIRCLPKRLIGTAETPRQWSKPDSALTAVLDELRPAIQRIPSRRMDQGFLRPCGDSRGNWFARLG